jgi:hypothetical protein
MTVIKLRTRDFVPNSHVQKCCGQRHTAVSLVVTMEGAGNFLISVFGSPTDFQKKADCNSCSTKAVKSMKLLKTVGNYPKDI